MLLSALDFEASVGVSQEISTCVGTIEGGVGITQTCEPSLVGNVAMSGGYTNTNSTESSSTYLQSTTDEYSIQFTTSEDPTIVDGDGTGVLMKTGTVTLAEAVQVSRTGLTPDAKVKCTIALKNVLVWSNETTTVNWVRQMMPLQGALWRALACLSTAHK